MPTLPSGLRLALWDEALIEHDANWFECPDGHFWYSIAAPEMGSPLFDKAGQVWTTPAHALAPRNHEEAAQFVQILEMADDGSGVWRGEWLADFPKYRTLSDADKTVWDAWLRRPETSAYLDQVIERCSQLAEKARTVTGYAIFKDAEPGLGTARGGAGGAAAGAALQTIGPEFARELKKNPQDPDGSWTKAVESSMVSGAASGASWALFPMKVFNGPLKNLAFQAFGVQPGVNVAVAADQGSATAQYNLGVQYGEDYAVAATWFRKAADQGHVVAQFNLGSMYLGGRGVSENSGEAAKWFRKAAGQGYADAQLNLGLMYTKGHGVPQNFAEAARWFRLAAEQGRALAQLNLGMMYTHGKGVQQNYAEALRWYRLAAEQGDANAQRNLGLIYLEAMKWYGLAAQQGDANAQNSIGLMHIYGHGVPQNPLEAYIWFSFAASGGDQDGAKHRDLAASLLTKEQIIEAQFQLGFRYGKGQGVPLDTSNALKWLRTAAEQGHPDAQADLGVLYARGDGVPTDEVRAYMWFSLSADQGKQQAAKYRDFMSGVMSPAQIDEAQGLARVWRPKHEHLDS